MHFPYGAPLANSFGVAHYANNEICRPTIDFAHTYLPYNLYVNQYTYIKKEEE